MSFKTEEDALIYHSFIFFLQAIFLKKENEAKKHYELLSEFVLKSPNSLDILGEIRKNYCLRLVKDFSNNTYTRAFGTKVLSLNDLDFHIDQEFKTEQNLKDFITNNKVLDKLLNIAFIGSEVETPYGRVDLLYKKEKSIFPCEVKLDVGDHSIVTQIEKYIQSYYLLLHYNHWDQIQGITLAKNYTEFSLKELKKLDVLILTYSLQNNKLKFNCII